MSLSILERVRGLVASRPDLQALLERQAASLPVRVFGSRRMPAREFLDIYLGEASFLLDIVRPRLKAGLRLLEVGGGLGLFHVLAAGEGAEPVSIEPSEGGFSLFRPFGLALISELTGRPDRFMDSRVESLPWGDGEFPLVVSNNVLEHVRDPAAALREMYRVLAPGGTMIHHCPNYLFPYEPHYKVPVLPGAVSLSGRLAWRRFRGEPLWESLNSVTSWSVRRASAALRGARLRFLPAVPMILGRLEKDSHLAARHGRLTRLALLGPVRALLRALPPALLTPMVFEIEKTGT